ncbi:MAG TPA: hypothetical protein VM938_06105 [Acidimicrobiales bacterium]|nr:hypothetical protein [Acidimicrobiales bacterium]
MPNQLEIRDRSLSTAQWPTSGHLLRQTGRNLARVEHRTIVRLANVQAEGLVQSEKLHEVDHLTRQAMSGQAMLARWRDTLAAGDPFVTDELKFFTDIARMAKGEIIADTIDTFCRESRS